jgi:hypothetical protein
MNLSSGQYWELDIHINHVTYQQAASSSSNFKQKINTKTVLFISISNELKNIILILYASRTKIEGEQTTYDERKKENKFVNKKYK